MRPLLLRICRSLILAAGDVFVAEEAVVVYRDLRVQRQDFAPCGEYKRVYLHEARVRLPEGFVEVLNYLPDALCRVAFETRGEYYLAHLVRLQPDQGVHVDPHYGVRVFLGDLLDVYAALGREEDERLSSRPGPP